MVWVAELSGRGKEDENKKERSSKRPNGVGSMVLDSSPFFNAVHTVYSVSRARDSTQAAFPILILDYKMV
jgi:hypothetical protein